MEKDLALRMLKAVEDLYLENMIMKDQLKSKGWANLERVLAEAKSDPRMREVLRQQFLPVRQRIEESAELEEAIQALLRVAPPTNKIN